MPALTSNTLTRQVDLPTWEWTRFAPAVSTAISSTCAADNGSFYQEEHGRYIYYLISATQFFRYDTWTDMYQQLSSPPIAPTAFTSMKYVSSGGVEEKVISAGSNTLTVPAVSQQALLGYDVVIVSGTGAGQRRTITAVAEPVIADSGIITSFLNVAGGINISDSTKSWAVNTYQGYTLRITANTGISQMRRILSNISTQIVMGDSLLMNKPWNNPALFSPTLSSTAGSQTNYAIESQVITVDSNWSVTPDTTSVFRIQSGLIYLVTTGGAPYFFTIQAYDILTDTWYILPNPQSFITLNGTDCAIERTSESASMWFRGAASSGSTTSLTDATLGVDRAAWTTNKWANYWVYIFSGTGVGQIRQISSNTTNTLNWTLSGTAPDQTSRYMITGFDAGSASSGTTGTLTDSTKSWTTNRWTNYAVRILAGAGAGSLRPILSNTSTTLTIIGSFSTAIDTTSVYAIQGDPDKLYIQMGGVASLGIYNLDSLLGTYGRQYDWGISRQASATVAGHQPVSITSVSNVTTTATVTTTTSHQFRVGELVTVRGLADSNYNVTNTVIASVPSISTFTYTMAGTPASNTITNSNSTTLLVDASKNWTVNQWAGYILYNYTAALTASSGNVLTQVFRITSNTATTLTLAGPGTAPLTGVSRYSIATQSAIGGVDAGVATAGGTTTTIPDTTKSWVTNIHAGKRVRILTTTGTPVEVAITSNTATVLTTGAVITAPTSAITSYVIIEGTSKGTGTNMNWAFGTSDANYRGRYMFLVRGGAVIGFDRWDITTDRFNLMFTTPATETLTTGTNTAYDGQDLLFFHKDATQRVMSLNVVTGKINGGSMYPYAAPSAILGNRMEIFTTKDGLRYVWINRASQQECFRCLIFW